MHIIKNEVATNKPKHIEKTLCWNSSMMTTTNEKPKPKKGTHHINDDEAKADSNMALIHLGIRDR